MSYNCPLYPTTRGSDSISYAVVCGTMLHFAQEAPLKVARDSAKEATPEITISMGSSLAPPWKKGIRDERRLREDSLLVTGDDQAALLAKATTARRV